MLIISKKAISIKTKKFLNLFKRKKNLELNKAKSSIIFNKDCVMDEKITLKSKDKCTVMLAAPGRRNECS